MNSLIRIDPKTKKAAQKILARLGLDLSSAIKIFLEQVVLTESIPFIITTRRGQELRRAKTPPKRNIEAA
ncbi:MAG: type II toxin-antitoxin system RelB/DinJ family antitoxin [bacterium]|nr:type II toxin-antitoxin system RelB/DinJ family antitoxin [bacterium]